MLIFFKIEFSRLSDAFKDLADGAAQTEEGMMLMAMGGDEFVKLAQEMASGELDPAELNNRLMELAPLIEKNTKNMSDAQLQALEQTNPALYKILSSNSDLLALTKKDAEIILICGVGGQAALTGKTLIEMGYKNVLNVGGIPDWEKNGGPMKKY